MRRGLPRGVVAHRLNPGDHDFRKTLAKLLTDLRGDRPFAARSDAQQEGLAARAPGQLLGEEVNERTRGRAWIVIVNLRHHAHDFDAGLLVDFDRTAEHDIAVPLQERGIY